MRVRESEKALNDVSSGGAGLVVWDAAAIRGWNQEKAGPSRREPVYKILLLSSGKREGCSLNLIWHLVRKERRSFRSPETIGGSGILGSCWWLILWGRTV